METVDIILNVLIALLLVITIIFCLVLSRRIATFNSSKTELAKFLLEFNDAIHRAEKNISQLKEMGDNVDENLKSQIKRARFLANDLSFLSEKGENVANHLEGKLSMTRDTVRKVNTENSINSQPKQTREVLSGEETFRPRTTAVPSESVTKNQTNPSKRQALDTLLQQIAKKKLES